MRLSVFYVFAVGLFVATPGFGQLDAEANRLGIYTDLEDYNWFNVFYPDNVVTAYIVLANPSVPEISRWEARLGFTELWSATGELPLVGVIFANDGINSGNGYEYEVDITTPIVCEQATVLATLLFLTDALDNVCLHISGIGTPSIPGDSPVIWAVPGDPMQVEPTQRYDNGVGAVITNVATLIGQHHPCETAVGIEDIGWSSLKALYR